MHIKQNLFFRIVLILLLIVPVVYFTDFYQHFYLHFTGNIITNIIVQQWHIVLLSILVFVAFLIPLSFRRKKSWVESGLVSAFFISLFVEMYGIPLTVFFASNYMLNPVAVMPPSVINFYFLGVGFYVTMAMAYGAALMLIGMGLILVGWITLYRNVKKNEFVKSGIYSFSRHPQYLGFILIVLGWFVGWPTILTVFFAPILVYKYISVCKKEEKEISKKYPKYIEYMKRVPFFI